VYGLVGAGHQLGGLQADGLAGIVLFLLVGILTFCLPLLLIPVIAERLELWRFRRHLSKMRGLPWERPSDPGDREG
jgi:hypothetical protein